MKKMTGMLFAVAIVLLQYSTTAEETEPTKSELRLTLPNTATHFYVEAQRLFVPGGTQLQLNISHDFNPTFGFFTYGELHRNWGQIYGGPTFSPASWLKVGTGIGIEETDNPTPIRFGSFLWVGNEKDSLFAVGNFGHSGYWWRAETNHRFSDWLGAGLFAQRDAGIGPRLQVTIPKKPIMFWIAPTYFWETGKPRVVGAIRLQF